MTANQFKVCAALGTREERGAAADQHRVDAQPVLVDQTQLGRLRSQRRASERDVAGAVSLSRGRATRVLTTTTSG